MDSWWGDIFGKGLKKKDENSGIKHQDKKNIRC